RRSLFAGGAIRRLSASPVLERSSRTLPSSSPVFGKALLPNKRLKLAGGYRSTGTGVSAPWRARAVVHYSCAGGRVARSLRAIRQAAAPGLEDWHGNTIAPPP